MDCSMPGFPVLHHLLKFAQTHVHWVGDAIQLFHSLLTPSPLPSIFPSIRIFSSDLALPTRWPKYCSFHFSISPSSEYSGLISFGITGLISLLSKGLSRVFSSTTVQKHQFFGTQSFLLSSSHIYTWLSIHSAIRHMEFHIMAPHGAFFSIFSDQRISFSWCFCLI